MNEGPTSSPLLESALAMHEIFLTFLEAGFSERQSLVMIAEMINNTQRD